MRVLLLLGLVFGLVVFPTAASAQQCTGYNCDGKRDIGQALANTLRANLERTGHTDQDIADAMSALEAYVRNLAQTSWLALARVLGFPTGSSLGAGGRDSAYCIENPDALICTATGGGWSGGGAQFGWNCDALDFSIDEKNNLIAPAMNLPNPKAIAYETPLWIAPNTDNHLNTTDAFSALKVGIHMYNLTQDYDKRYAPMFINVNAALKGVLASYPAHYSNGVLVNSAVKSFASGRNSRAWPGDIPPGTGDCEPGIAVGAFELHYQGCASPPDEWAIPLSGIVPLNQIGLWSKGNQEAGACPIDPELIRWLTEHAWKGACETAGYTGPACGPIEIEDVRTGGETPTIRETGDTPVIPEPNDTPSEPAVDPTGEPTGEPSGGSSGSPDWTNPNVGAPSVTSPSASSLVDKAFDWFPELPSIEIDLGGAECPTYSADFFGHELVLDSHCPFIEQNRATISAIMIVIFTIAAAAIVLRA
ncbi:hypothetical protein [Novosphingobium album (ex Liu et al. 2023)]|nr:hypothetical protein [Novosphingobium album (ex Liu et al. 2023)]